MKTTILTVLAMFLTGCSTYSTHLKTGCVWSCAEWEQRLANQGPVYYGGPSMPSPSASTIITPGGNYVVIPNYSTGGVSAVIGPRFR